MDLEIFKKYILEFIKNRDQFIKKMVILYFFRLWLRTGSIFPVMMLHMVLHYVFQKIGITTKWTFKSVIGRVSTLVKLHFVDIAGGIVALFAF